jgi:hypothetical protein
VSVSVWLATIRQENYPFGVDIVGVWPGTVQGRQAAQRACDARLTLTERRYARRRGGWRRYVDDTDLWECLVQLDCWAQVQRYHIGVAVQREPTRFQLATIFGGITLAQWRESYAV